MEMVSFRLYLALTLFTAACTTSAAISTGCTSNIEILQNNSVAQQLESYLKNDMDIIEIHLKTNTCIALRNDDNTISNESFESASTIEKYNMFIYFIVTDTGRAIMQYPADADTLSIGVLGSQKVLINVDVMLDNNACALNTEQFGTMSLKALSALAQIRNISDKSVCYYKVSEYSCWHYLLLSIFPYFTYNTFNTLCLTGGVTTELPQAMTNKLLYWLCVVLHITLPVGFFFIPHSVHERTDSYRKCDVPFSVSMFLSYIAYWKPVSKCCCCKKVNSKPREESFVPYSIICASCTKKQEKNTSLDIKNDSSTLLGAKKQGENTSPDSKYSSIALNTNKQGENTSPKCETDSTTALRTDKQEENTSSDKNYCFCKCKTIKLDFLRPMHCCGCCKNNCTVFEDKTTKGIWWYFLLLWKKHVERLLIFIALFFFAAGLFIHYILNRRTNVLENELMIYTLSSAFSYFHMKDSAAFILPIFFISLVLTTLLWAVCRIYFEIGVSQATEISYPIYIPLVEKSRCLRCYNVFDLKLKTDRADLNTTIKMVSEVIFSATFWFELFIASYCIGIIITGPLVLICCIPYINNCISSVVKECETIGNNDKKKRCKKFFITCFHISKLLFTIVTINIMLIQTATLVLQMIVLTLFVGIPVYPKHLACIILLTGLIKYIMQAFLRFQSKSKHVLDEMFKADEYKDKEYILKERFTEVLKQCSSVNVCVLCMNILAIVFVWFTAFVAIKHGPKGLSAWKDVLPSIILFIGPDWLSKFIYNEEADNQFIEQCVKRAMEAPTQQNKEGLTREDYIQSILINCGNDLEQLKECKDRLEERLAQLRSSEQSSISTVSSKTTDDETSAAGATGNDMTTKVVP